MKIDFVRIWKVSIEMVSLLLILEISKYWVSEYDMSNKLANFLFIFFGGIFLFYFEKLFYSILFED